MISVLCFFFETVYIFIELLLHTIATSWSVLST